MRKVDDGKRKEKKRKKKITAEIVATNVVASRPPNGDGLQRRRSCQKKSVCWGSLKGKKHPFQIVVTRLRLLYNTEFYSTGHLNRYPNRITHFNPGTTVKLILENLTYERKVWCCRD